MTTPGPAPNPFAAWLLRYREDPVAFVREVLGAEPWGWQADVLEALAAEERRVSIRSGHRVGKSCLLAWVVLWHALTRFPQKTLCLAATERQMFNALVPEIKLWHNRIQDADVRDLLVVQTEQIKHAVRPAESFIVFAAARSENPEAIAGAHSQGSVLIVVDEGSGVPDAAYESLAGAMGGPQAITLIAGNPVRRRGFFADTQTRLAKRPGQPTDGAWLTFHVSSKDNVNVDQDIVGDIRRRYGENSNAYRVRVLGEFPVSEDDTIISYEKVAAALDRDVRPEEAPWVWGLDVAAGGEDRTVLLRRKGNMAYRPEVWYKLDPMQVAGRIKDQWDRCPAPTRPKVIFVDVIIWGAGVCSRLRE